MAYRLRMLAGGLAWAAVMACGFMALGRYESTPGRAGRETARWPADCLIPLASSCDTLVMLAHPRCPCTEASVAELSKIMARCQGRLEARVLFYAPPHTVGDWAKTSLWKSAEAIPKVQVFADRGGREAARMGAETSGQVLLFDPSGRLLFKGGITGARGEEGDNLGSQAVAALVTGGKAAQTRSLVFGCPILDRRRP
jgi:hypothetical protein